MFGRVCLKVHFFKMINFVWMQQKNQILIEKKNMNEIERKK